MSLRKHNASSRSFLVLLGLAISGILLFFAFRNVDFPKLLSIAESVSWQWIGVAAWIAFFHGFIMARKWQLVLKGFSKMLTYWDAFWSLRLANFFNASLPARLGEAVRLIFIKLKTGIGVGKSLGSLAADRAVDLIALVLLASVGFLGVQKESGSWNSYSLFVLAGIILFCVIAVGLFPIKKIESRMASRWKSLKVVFSFVSHVQMGIRTLFNRNILVEMFSLALFGWLTQTFLLLVVAFSFGYELSFFEAVLVVTAVSFAVALPSAPGNFGTFEFAAIFVLHRLLGRDLESSAFVTLAYHLVQFFPTILVGLVGIVAYRQTLFGNWSQIRSLRKET